MTATSWNIQTKYGLSSLKHLKKKDCGYKTEAED